MLATKQPFVACGKLMPMLIRRKMGLAVFSVLLISACSDSTPPIGRGLPKSFGPTPDFDRRIKERFPVGSDAESSHRKSLNTRRDIVRTKATITEIKTPARRYARIEL
jgi:hypothetical protein